MFRSGWAWSGSHRGRSSSAWDSCVHAEDSHCSRRSRKACSVRRLRFANGTGPKTPGYQAPRSEPPWTNGAATVHVLPVLHDRTKVRAGRLICESCRCATQNGDGIGCWPKALAAADVDSIHARVVMQSRQQHGDRRQAADGTHTRVAGHRHTGTQAHRHTHTDGRAPTSRGPTSAAAADPSPLCRFALFAAALCRMAVVHTWGIKFLSRTAHGFLAGSTPLSAQCASSAPGATPCLGADWQGTSSFRCATETYEAHPSSATFGSSP